MIEVDENLCRAELTASEKAKALKKRQILWESLKEQELGGTQGATQKATARKDRPQNQQAFAAATAAAVGMSKKNINEYIRQMLLIRHRYRTGPALWRDCMAALPNLPDTA